MSLLRFERRARGEVATCRETKAYLAGCILIGAMTEYLMMTMIRIFPNDVYRRGRKLGEYWTLKGLNDFAHDCGWFSDDVYAAAERIRTTRNMMHPHWYARKQPPRITKHLLSAREKDYTKVLDCVWEWVVG